MQLDLDVRDRRVVVLGTAGGARSAVSRFAFAGARVTLAATDALPLHRLDGVRHVSAPNVGDTSALLRLLGPAWMVVLVDPGRELRDRVVELAGLLKLLTTTEPVTATHRIALLAAAAPPRPAVPVDQAPGA